MNYQKWKTLHKQFGPESGIQRDNVISRTNFSTTKSCLPKICSTHADFETLESTLTNCSQQFARIYQPQLFHWVCRVCPLKFRHWNMWVAEIIRQNGHFKYINFYVKLHGYVSCHFICVLVVINANKTELKVKLRAGKWHHWLMLFMIEYFIQNLSSIFYK